MVILNSVDSFNRRFAIVRNLFAALCMLALVVMIWDGAWLQKEFKSLERPKKEIAFDLLPKPDVPLEPLESFRQAILARSLFRIPEEASSVAVTIDRAQETLKNFRLRGIVHFASPEAIIEDARTSKAMFLRRGERLQGLRVKRIHPDRVELSDGKQSLQLTLQRGTEV